MGRQPVGQGHDAVGPDLALEGPGAFGAVLEARQHLGDGAAFAGARQTVEIVDVVESREVFVQARPEIKREIGPARPDIDAAQLQSRQQRDGVGLVLAELLPHAPHPAVVERQRFVGAVQVDQEQCEMPPVVGVHERVAVVPGVGDGTEEGDAFQHPAARFQAVRNGVMRPRIAAVDRQPLARGGLGLVEAIALFEAERVHAPDEAVVGVGGDQALTHVQQRLGVAAVEGQQLRQLAGQKVARPVGDDPAELLQAAVGVTGDPELDGAEPREFAKARACRHLLCAGEVSRGGRVTLG